MADVQAVSIPNPEGFQPANSAQVPSGEPEPGYCSNLPAGDPHYGADAQRPPEGTKAMADLNKVWPNGKTLQVFFLTGTDSWGQTVREAVQRIARTWSDYANIKFEFVSTPVAHITINLVPLANIANYGTYNCWHGTDCIEMGIKRGLPSMNLVFNPNLASQPAFMEQEFQRVILHEFGHSLALIHEHYRPDSPITWNESAVLGVFGKPPNNWSLQTIRDQITKAYQPQGGITKLKGTAFDLQSIMMYSFPPGLATFNDGRPFQTPNNIKLSPLDKVLINMVYPMTGVTDPNDVPLVPGDPAKTGEIKQPGQVVRYSFMPEDGSVHVIETQGSTPVLVALLTEHKQPTGRTLAFEGANAQFSFLPTNPGKTYFLEVRHAKPMTGTGSFSISVRKQG